MDLRDKILLLFDEQDTETEDILTSSTKPQISTNGIENRCMYHGSLRDAVEKNPFLADFFKRFHNRHIQSKKLPFFEFLKQKCRL